MSLASLLSAEQIIPEMKATERWPAIVELIDLLVRQDKIKAEDRESILASLKQREETMSTGIGFGIAIPQPLPTGSNRSSRRLAGPPGNRIRRPR